MSDAPVNQPPPIVDVVNNNFAQQPPPGPLLPCQVPIFEAHIIGVQFLSPIRVARRDATITGEHWTEGVNVVEPFVVNGSIKPAVLLIATRGDPRMTVRIRVTRSQNVGPTGPLRGSLGGLAFSSLRQCPTGVGDHSVAVKIDALPTAIRRDAGDATWSMDVNPVGTVQLGTTRLEVVTVLDAPSAFYATGVWIEALRRLCAQAGVVGISQKRQAAAAVSRFCFGQLGLIYDTNVGGPHYGADRHGATDFQLARYINMGAGKVVNCYDQAAGLTALAGALGVRLDWKYMAPFGYLATCNLIGVGQCNNPFYRSNNSTPTIGGQSTDRTGFGNHAFTAFPRAQNADVTGVDGGAAEGIGDACAGPSTFDGTLADYVATAVDQVESRRRRRLPLEQRIAQINAQEATDVAAVNTAIDADEAQEIADINNDIDDDLAEELEEIDDQPLDPLEKYAVKAQVRALAQTSRNTQIAQVRAAAQQRRQVEGPALIAQIRAQAAQRRTQPLAEIAQINAFDFTTAVTDQGGVTSLQFAGYAGP